MLAEYELLNALGTWAAALTSALATVIALFLGLKQELLKKLRPAKIYIEWEDCEPCAQVTKYNKDLVTPAQVMYRLKLINHGKSAATDLQVALDKLERIQPRHQNWVDSELPWQPVPGFVPASLQWTHLNQPTLDFFPVGSSRYLDFGLWQWDHPSPNPSLNLSTEVELKGAKLDAGKYRCQIVVTNRDGVLHKSWWNFEFTDAYPASKQHPRDVTGFQLKLDKLLLGEQLGKALLFNGSHRHEV